MPSTQALRRRIRSIRSTRQITKAMELVSAAKMRRASEATLAGRPYAETAQMVLADLLKQPVEGVTHPLLSNRVVKKVLIFAIASDRSLAGAYNALIFREVTHLIQEAETAGQKVEIITLGKQVARALAHLDTPIIQSYTHENAHPTVATLEPVSQTLTQGFLSGEFDKVMVVYTSFKNLITQEVKVSQLLPLQGNFSEESDETRSFSYEPSPLDALNAVLPRVLEAELYHFLEESLASEHAARRMAMHNASDNASDMIDDLTLTYNGIRQDSITRELAEITAGASA